MTTTGRLTGQDFSLDETIVEQGPIPRRCRQGAGGERRNADRRGPAGEGSARGLGRAPGRTGDALQHQFAQDDSLRNADCRANVYHVAPSRSMLTDALGAVPRLLEMAARLPRRRQGPGRPALRRRDAPLGQEVRPQADRRQGRGSSAILPANAPMDRPAPAPSSSRAGRRGGHDRHRRRGRQFRRLYPVPHLGAETRSAARRGWFPATWSRVLDAWGSAQLQSRFVRTNKRPMRRARLSGLGGRSA